MQVRRHARRGKHHGLVDGVNILSDAPIRLTADELVSETVAETALRARIAGRDCGWPAMDSVTRMSMTRLKRGSLPAGS
jgi:hypothetical protein